MSPYDFLAAGDFIKHVQIPPLPNQIFSSLTVIHALYAP
jgi:hypothetical protein